jgi:hypothetical protein
MNDEVFSITEMLPDNGERVLCFGHLTFCCKEDMEEIPEWHEVTFSCKFDTSTIKWEVGDYDDMRPRIIYVTQWKYLP